jgi:hypothetical protein
MTSPPADASIRGLQAVAMIELFASVGATAFDITHTNIDSEKRGFRGNRSVAEVRESMPPLIASADRRQNNVIVRPRMEGATCIQLDDLDREKARTVAPAAFLILETSPGSFQAWVSVRDAAPGITARLRKGAGADLHASGATRVAGSQNFKRKYAPQFPIVRMAGTRRGHVVTVAELEALNILAPESAPVEIVGPGANVRTDGRAARSWPSYQMCLERAPESQSRPGHPRESVADFTWCKIATSWGHSPEATAARLMQESAKAQENGPEYALQTAQRAAWAAAQRNRQMKP